MRDLAGKRTARLAAAALALAAALAPAPALAATATKTMYRLYNPNSGEHFYTASAKERDSVTAAGWSYEGVGWTAPAKSNSPVYRLYSGTDHHYTTSAAERDHLVSVGWKYEGVGWYSDDAKGVPLYRQFNPYVVPSAPRNNSGSHNYTTSKAENDHLVSLGWRAEGVGWYGVGSGSGQSEPANPTRPADPGPFADDAGKWSVWGTCEWRVQGGTLYVRPTNAWNGEGTISVDPGGYGAPWRPSLLPESSKVTKVASSGTIHVRSAWELFHGFKSLTDISALRSWDTSSATDMSYMFSDCTSLKDLTPLSAWDTSHVRGMGDMFSNCASLTNLSPLTRWNTSAVVDTGAMFMGCTALTDLSPLAGWDTHAVMTMGSMFEGCVSLSDLRPLSGWDMSSVWHTGGMFEGCTSLSDIGPLAGWDVSYVAQLGNMFEGCTALSDITPLSGWNTSNLAFVGYVFKGCTSLKDARALEGWDVSSVEWGIAEMFDESLPAARRPSWAR